MKTISIILILIIGIVANSFCQKPKTVYQLGAVKVIVWIDTVKGKDSTYTVKNFEVEKVYKKNNEWKTTNQFNEKDLLELRAIIDKAINEEIIKVEETGEK